jgi:hypothetical protein
MSERMAGASLKGEKGKAVSALRFIALAEEVHPCRAKSVSRRRLIGK